MKINIITLHCTDNCGSTLQTLALQNYISSLGHRAEIIDYRPKYLFENGNKLKAILSKILFFRLYKNKMNKIRKFENKYLKLSSVVYKSNSDLVNAPPKADLYITGSDQIWNTGYKCGMDLSYYLNFVSEGKKMAYAASLGKENFDINEINFLKNAIIGFDTITVREKLSVAFLKDKLNLDASFVCDPVFLMNKEYYSSIEKKPNIENYLVVYLVKESVLLDSLIKTIKEKYNLKVIEIGGMRKHCNSDYHIKDVSADEFIGYLNHARYIVASSFHATAFSHIFKKDFAIVLPNKNSMRIESILNESGLISRIVSSESDIDNVISGINYDNIDLSRYIEKSKNIIGKKLGDEE